MADETENTGAIQRAAGQGGIGSDLLLPALHANPDSYPVLKAFNDILDAERERSRRKLVTLSLCSFFVVVFLVAGFLIAGTVMFGNLTRKNDELQKVVMQSAIKDAVAAVPSVENPSYEELKSVRDTMERMASESAALRDSIRREIEAAPSFDAAAMAAMVAQAVSNATVNAIAMENAKERDRIAKEEARRAKRLEDARKAREAKEKEAKLAEEKAAKEGKASEIVSMALAKVSEAPKFEDGYKIADAMFVTEGGATIPWRIATPAE